MSLLISAAVLLSIVTFVCGCCCCCCYWCKAPKISPTLHHTTEEPPSNGSASSLSERSGRASRTLSNSDTHVDALAQAEEGNINEPHISVWGQHPTTEEIPPNGSASSLSERSGRASRTHNSDTHVDALAQAEEGRTHITLYSEDLANSLSESEQEEVSWFPAQLHTYRTIPGFQNFIAQRVIPGFEGQRRQRYQFAVLLLVPESALNNINLMSLQPNDYYNQQPLVNNINASSPNRQHYRNYVAARPEGGRHSEVTLLEELPHLWKAFVASYHVIPSYIILYSWMMPCPECTERLCRDQTLQNTNASVIVAYTIDWKEVSYDDNERSRLTLQAAGINVEEVKYDPYLAPASNATSLVQNTSCHQQMYYM